MTNLEIQTNADICMKFFTQQGFTPLAAAALVGNFFAESNIDPKAVNVKEGAYGIAQWRGERVMNFRNFTGTSITNSTLEQQLEFVMWELKNTHRTASSLLSSALDVAMATGYIDKYYEKSDGSALAKRIDYASKQLKLWEDSRLDSEVEYSMDASDPPSVVQPGDTTEPVNPLEPPAVKEEAKKNIFAEIIQSILALIGAIFGRR